MDPDFVKEVEGRNIRYWNCLHSKDDKKNGYQSWQNRFITEDKNEVTEFLESVKYSYSWEGSTLFYWQDLPPVTKHILSGEKLWFNQITSAHWSYYSSFPCFDGLNLAKKEYPCHTTFADGEEFRLEDIDNYRKRIWEAAVGFDWQNGDILFLDQLIVQHSRLSFEGERRVGVSLRDY